MSELVVFLSGWFVCGWNSVTSCYTYIHVHVTLSWKSLCNINLWFFRTSTSGHLSTDRQTDSPYIDSYLNFSTTATSLQPPLSSAPKVAIVSGEIQLYFFSCWALPFHLSLQKEHWTTAQKYCKTWRLLEEGSLTRPTTLANGSKSKQHQEKLLWHNHLSIKIMTLKQNTLMKQFKLVKILKIILNFWWC